MSLSKSKTSVVKYFDGDVYTRYFSHSYDVLTRLTGWRRKIARHALNDLPRGKLLDVGCGTGYLMSLAQDLGFEVYGLDASSGMVAQAQKKYGFDNQHIVVTGAEAIPFDSASFDVVIASGSLVHIPQIQKASQEMVRVLKPGGHLRVVDHAIPQKKNLYTPFATLFSHLSGDILHDYPHYFHPPLKLTNRRTLGRGGYMQSFDFIKS